jgi:hypothetical protein
MKRLDHLEAIINCYEIRLLHHRDLKCVNEQQQAINNMCICLCQQFVKDLNEVKEQLS